MSRGNGLRYVTRNLTTHGNAFFYPHGPSFYLVAAERFAFCFLLWQRTRHVYSSRGEHGTVMVIKVEADTVLL